MRGLLNSVPTVWLLVAAVALALCVVLPSVLLVRRLVPATREGYHAEISAPMLGVVSALFGLFFAFVIIIAYQNAAAGLNQVFAALRTVKPTSPQETAFYDDAVTQLNTTLAARQERLRFVAGGIPGIIVILLLFSTFVIVAYAVFVGSPNFRFHALAPAAISVVVAVSLVVLVDLSYPFSGNVTISPDGFKTGELAQFFGEATGKAPAERG